jgi:hypothetical protein
MTEPLAWTHRASEIPDTGLRVSKAATEAERLALAEALEVLSCEAAKVDYTIRAIGGGQCRMSGEVSARLDPGVRGDAGAALDRAQGRF